MKAKSQNSRIFRSSLEQIVNTAENVRAKIKDYPKHLQAMKKCPFWGFYQPFHQGRMNQEDMKKKQKGLEHIFNTFDPIKKVFEIQGKEFKPTAEQLAVIFGLQRTKGVKEFSLRHPAPEILAAQVVFYKTYLKGKKMLKKDVIDSLYATAEDVTKSDDFVKLLVLYFCIVVFFPSQGGDKLPKMFLKYIFEMDQVSWPDLIHSYFLEALKQGKKPCKSVKGCAVYILFWFAEITHFIGKYEGEQGRSKPRFARWNTRVLAEKITNEGMITSLKQDLTGSFIDPLDESEQGLITPIEIHQANPDGIGEKMVRDRERDEDRKLSPDRDAARYLEDLAPVSLSKRRKAQAPVSLSKRRKASMDISRPCDVKGSCNKKPAHLPSSESMVPAIPNLLTQEFRGKESEDDGHHNSEKDLHDNDVHIGSSSSYSETHTTAQEIYDVTHAKRKKQMEGLENKPSQHNSEISSTRQNGAILQFKGRGCTSPVSSSQKRKMSSEESGSSGIKEVCRNNPEHLPLSRSNYIPTSPVPLIQECVTENNEDYMEAETDESLGGFDNEDNNIQAESDKYCEGFDNEDKMQAESDESLEGFGSVVKPVEAPRTTSSAEHVEAAKTTSTVKSPTVDSKFVSKSSPKDVSGPSIECTSVSGQESEEKFELVDNFKIPKEYAVLYKKIFDKYGHMATRKVIKLNDTILVACVTSLLQIVSTMEILRGVDLSEALLERWEGDIKDVENLGFNITWLREKLNEVKNNWKSSSGIRKEVEIHKKELDATQVKCVRLLTRKEELQRETSEVIIQIRKAEAKILFEKKAIQQKLAPKSNFLREPVLGKVLS